MTNHKLDRNQIKLHLILLGYWIILGIILRWINLADKSASSTEIATLGYSLGQSFFDLPLDQIISLNQLLSPLQLDSTSTPNDVMYNLLREDNHPPLYFLLNHWWLKFFASDGEVVSLWVGRSLSAIFGVVTIPAIFGLGWLAFSPLVGQFSAALMAVSPYGIYLAQESRHYTFTILWIIASLVCWITAIRYIKQRRLLTILLGCFWVITNSFGIASHYFFSLVLAADGLVIAWLWLRDIKNAMQRYWWRIYTVGLGTFIGFLVWLPVLAIGNVNNELTDWISTSFELDEIWHPIPRLLAWILTMVWLLPFEGTSLFVIILSAITLLVILVWVSPYLWRGWKMQINSNNGFSLRIFVGFFLGAIALFLVVIYGLGKDLSLAARYHFVYFPVVIILLAVALAGCWDNSSSLIQPSMEIKEQKITPKDLIFSSFKQIEKIVVIAILVMGFCGALTVVTNYGYQKARRADLLAEIIQKESAAPPLVATTYQTHSEIRALIALGLEFKRQENPDFFKPQFLLVKRQEEQRLTPDSTLAKVISEMPLPLDLWGVDLKVEKSDLENFNCREYSESQPKINGYRHKYYRCR
ncbi:MAG: glycosyltransferase family 39 protein [Microcoleaceae cyanobacterium MO_207.B10]|nr:glycosyltransferase family 39 protein [Microcoleaceae cyanobacterium MO_207.B10]